MKPVLLEFREMVFEVDDFVMVGKKRVALNLNNYRNAHYQTLNKAKILFKKKLYEYYPEVLHLRAEGVRVSYTLRPKDRLLFDTMNIVSIVDKFFMDALVEAEVIPDDDYSHAFIGEINTLPPEIKSEKKKVLITCTFF